MKLLIIWLFLPLVLLARPLDIRSPNLEPSRGGKPQSPVVVPTGCDQLLSAGCRVSSSDADLSPQTLLLVTDGEKDFREIKPLKLAPGVQWVQLDLGIKQKIYAVYIWRYLSDPHVVRDMIVQLSNDVMFLENVETVFNNDHDNTVGLGAGADKEYIEHFMGRSIPVNGIQARYIRVYSNGSVMDGGRINKANYYTEIEVYGEPYVTLPMAVPQSTLTSDKSHLSIYVPANATNVLSRKCDVTASDTLLQKKDLSLIVDGNKEINEIGSIDLDPVIAKQWLQLDLGQEKEIFALCIWHDYTQTYANRNVVVQLSNDQSFMTGVATVFNNDVDDNLGFGKRQDNAYTETLYGYSITVDGVKARYIRIYGQFQFNPQFYFKEIEAYGRDPNPSGNIKIRVNLPKPQFS